MNKQSYSLRKDFIFQPSPFCSFTLASLILSYFFDISSKKKLEKNEQKN